MDQFDDLYSISRLISGYLKDDLSENEKQELENWLDARPANRAQFDRLVTEDKLQSDFLAYGQTDKESAWKRIVKETGYRKSRTSFPFYRVAAAASIILALIIGSYSLLHKKAEQQFAQNQTHEILPGGNKAILTLANGRQISLTDARTGKLAVQGNTAISKTAAGQVVYEAVKSGTGKPESPIAYNTISTPRGGQYHLTLADGTNVWLNTASSIKYPAVFAGKERLVELIGEAYFEVTHNKAMPFRVKTTSQMVEDIGTHFNINAYTDEPSVKTTLLEGAVKVTHDNEEKMLVPGEQASFNRNMFSVAKTNVEETIAWKNGYFRFINTPLPVIMRQFSRWYDINVVYDGHPDNAQYFNGKITRNANLSRVLTVLKQGGIKYEIRGRQLIILSDSK